MMRIKANVDIHYLRTRFAVAGSERAHAGRRQTPRDSRDTLLALYQRAAAHVSTLPGWLPQGSGSMRGRGFHCLAAG
jgi:hypothetical protein